MFNTSRIPGVETGKMRAYRHRALWPFNLATLVITAATATGNPDSYAPSQQHSPETVLLIGVLWFKDGKMFESKSYCCFWALLLVLSWQATGFWTLLMSLSPADCLPNQSSSFPLHFIHAPVLIGVCLLLLSRDLSELVYHLCVWLSPFAFQLMLLHTIPMCSAQYERMFNTTRVPGVDTGRVFSSASSSTFLLLYFSLGHLFLCLN